LFVSVESIVVSLHAAKLILIGPDPGRSWEVVESSTWDIWEGIIENFSSGEGDGFEEIVWSSSLAPVTGLSWFSRVSHDFVIGNSIRPGFWGDGVLSRGSNPGEVEAVWHLRALLVSSFEKDLIN